ncbi:MAG: hypothetical protein ACYS83_04205 [Planctomycetota bacterium]|jgi:hypothetical protein
MRIIAIILNLILLGIAVWLVVMEGMPTEPFDRFFIVYLFACPIVNIIAFACLSKTGWAFRKGKKMEEVNNSLQRQKTSKAVLIGVCLSVGVLMLSVFWWLSHVRWSGGPHPTVWCSSNMSGLVKAMVVYAHGCEPHTIPAAEKWCDLLIEEDFTTCKAFVCRVSDTIRGECSYAMNKHVAGKDISKLPPDTVVLFETNFGRHPCGRQGLLKERAYYKVMPHGRPETKVYKLRWNQVGGPELLTVENHKGEGCHVVFADLSVRFVETRDLGKLKWKPDQEQ